MRGQIFHVPPVASGASSTVVVDRVASWVDIQQLTVARRRSRGRSRSGAYRLRNMEDLTPGSRGSRVICRDLTRLDI